MTAACSPECPDGWQQVDEGAEPRVCQPPASATAAAERALGSGIYGYALQCADEDTDVGSCGCTPEGLACCGTFTITDADAVNGWPSDGIVVEVRPDGTFRTELPPGVRYTFGRGTWSAYSESGEAIDTFTLEEGEVRFFRAAVGAGC